MSYRVKTTLETELDTEPETALRTRNKKIRAGLSQTLNILQSTLKGIKIKAKSQVLILGIFYVIE
jgi:hypothetical protein